MEIILKQDVNRLGKAGAIAKVKDGFARNFLIPNDLAIPLTAVNLKKLEDEKQKKTLELEKCKKEAQDLAAKLEGLSLTVAVLTQEEDKLYASVTIVDVVHALKEEGFNIDKSCIILEESIKSLGVYEVSIKLHPEVAAKVKVWIVKK